jgi:hypothetical protein
MSGGATPRSFHAEIDGSRRILATGCEGRCLEVGKSEQREGDAKTVPLPVSSTTSQRCGRLFAEQGDESVSQAIPETELEKNPDHAGCSGSYIFLFSMMWTVPLEACSRARPIGCRFLTFARRAAISSMLPNILSCR